MKVYNYNHCVKGWFVGQFTPTCFATANVEVATKFYHTGDYDSKHYHKIATEITHIVSGRVLMNQTEYRAGDIIVIEPGEITDFKCLEDTITVVVKIPGILNDKYLPE